MSVEPKPQKKRGLLVALVVGVFALVAVGAAALLANIAERKEAAKHQYVKVVDVTEDDTDPAKWGKNWPARVRRLHEDRGAQQHQVRGRRRGQRGASPPPRRRSRDPW